MRRDLANVRSAKSSNSERNQQTRFVQNESKRIVAEACPPRRDVSSTSQIVRFEATIPFLAHKHFEVELHA